MKKKIYKIPLDEQLRDKIYAKINEIIEKRGKLSKIKFDEKEKALITGRVLDQISCHISYLAGLNTVWVIDGAELPMSAIILCDKSLLVEDETYFAKIKGLWHIVPKDYPANVVNFDNFKENFLLELFNDISTVTFYAAGSVLDGRKFLNE